MISDLKPGHRLLFLYALGLSLCTISAAQASVLPLSKGSLFTDITGGACARLKEAPHHPG